jgi:hypothetical protein
MLQDLRDAIGTSGRVEEEYGGYQITIQDAERFPWYRIFNMLLESSSFDVWLEKSEEDRLQIVSKPVID